MVIVLDFNIWRHAVILVDSSSHVCVCVPFTLCFCSRILSRGRSLDDNIDVVLNHDHACSMTPVQVCLDVYKRSNMKIC
jgi:hypothetical protein